MKKKNERCADEWAAHGQTTRRPHLPDNLVSGNAPYRVAPSSASPRKFDENREIIQIEIENNLRNDFNFYIIFLEFLARRMKMKRGMVS